MEFRSIQSGVWDVYAGSGVRVGIVSGGRGRYVAETTNGAKAFKSRNEAGLYLVQAAGCDEAETLKQRL